jgi:hypothetical protein
MIREWLTRIGLNVRCVANHCRRARGQRRNFHRAEIGGEVQRQIFSRGELTCTVCASAYSRGIARLFRRLNRRIYSDRLTFRRRLRNRLRLRHRGRHSNRHRPRRPRQPKQRDAEAQSHQPNPAPLPRHKFDPWSHPS